MKITILLLFAIISPIVALYTLEYSTNDIGEKVDLKSLILPKNLKQICTYVFFILSTIVLLLYNSADLLTLIIDCFLIMFGYTAAIIDLFMRKVPNKLVLVMFEIWILLTLIRIFTDFENGMQILIASTIGFLVGGGLMLIVYLVSRKGLGAGDVKFMSVVGLYLSYRWILSVMFIGGVLCFFSAIILMIMKKIRLKDSLPLIPFIYIGIILTILLR